MFLNPSKWQSRKNWQQFTEGHKKLCQCDHPREVWVIMQGQNILGRTQGECNLGISVLSGEFFAALHWKSTPTPMTGPLKQINSNILGALVILCPWQCGICDNISYNLCQLTERDIFISVNCHLYNFYFQILWFVNNANYVIKIK